MTFDDKDFDLLRKDLEHASHAPGYIYSSPEVLKREIEEYFMRDWLYVGRVEEIPKPGDYLAMRIVDEPILLARATDGTIGAFYNMCLHRGVEIAQGSGNTRSFKCPYHGWAYDLKGNLRGAAHMEDAADFTPRNCKLREVRFDTWKGNMFVSFAKEGPSLLEQIGALDQDFAFLQMENCRLGNKVVMELGCNWKLVHENVMDFYHVPVLHAKTLGTYFEWKDEDVKLNDNGGMSIWYENGTQTPDGKTLFERMPWLKDRDPTFACTGFMPPNFSLFGRIDNARVVVAWPISESRSLVIFYQLFPEEVFAMPDFAERLEVYREYSKVVIGEDQSMIESMQKAMGSKNFVPGRMCTQEKPLHHFLNGYARRIFPIHEEKV